MIILRLQGNCSRSTIMISYHSVMSSKIYEAMHHGITMMVREITPCSNPKKFQICNLNYLFPVMLPKTDAVSNWEGKNNSPSIRL